MDSLPYKVRLWIQSQLAEVGEVTDVSWDREDSQVWRIASGLEYFYAKVSPSSDAWQREVYAYENVVPCLPDGCAPRLRSVRPDISALLLSDQQGKVVRGLETAAEAERLIHEAAGTLLRIWHAHVKPVQRDVPAQVHASLKGQALEAASCLDAVGEILTDDERALVQRIAESLPSFSEKLPIVFCHGDFSPRNWLWDAEASRCGLIDFESSEHDVAIRDLVWLCGGVWTTREDLRDAFLSGFGRDLTAVEGQALPLLTARLAVSYLTTGIRDDNAILTERGRVALAGLARATPTPTSGPKHQKRSSNP